MVIKNNGLFSSEIGDTTSSKTPTQQAIPQILAVTVKNILLVAFGLTLGYPTILIPGLTDPAENFSIGEDGLSWIGSINMICVPLGCLASGYISQVLGRRRAMQIVNVPFVAAWLMFYFATEEWQILMALALTGLTGGFLEAPIITYVAEISQPSLRGLLSASSNVACLLGILIAFGFGSILHWRTLALASCGFHFISFLALFFIPESPHWLITKNRTTEAQKSLAYLRGWTTIDKINEEYQDIYMDIKKSSSQKKSILGNLALLCRKEFLWPYALITFCFILAHCTGMQVLQVYAILIFDTFKIDMNPYYATVILGVVQLFASILCVLIIYFTGKRLLNFVVLVLLAICNVVIGVYAQVNHIDSLIITGNETSTLKNTIISTDNYSWIPLSVIIIFSFVSNVGVRTLPWILTGELFPHNIRALAAGLSAAISYIIMFISSKVYFDSINILTFGGTFYSYAALAIIGVITLYYILPETEGKTLAEICNHFGGGKKLNNKVSRNFNKQKPSVLDTIEGQVNVAYIQELTTKS